MKEESREYIKWSSLGDVVLYMGRGPNGKTLSAVRQLVEEKDPRPILTNAHLNLPNATFGSTPAILFAAQDRRVFVDIVDIAISSRDRMSRMNTQFAYLLTQARKLNVKVIMTAQSPRFLDHYVQDRLTAILFPEFRINKYGTPKTRLQRIYRDKVVSYPWVNARKYFKYYDTMEMIKHES